MTVDAQIVLPLVGAIVFDRWVEAARILSRGLGLYRQPGHQILLSAPWQNEAVPLAAPEDCSSLHGRRIHR